MENRDFLNAVDMGYVGLSKPQVTVIKEEDSVPAWVTRKFEYLARKEGLTYYEFMDKYGPSLDPMDWDNDPGSPEQAWA